MGIGRIVQVQMGISLFLGGLNACPDGLGHLPFSEAYNPVAQKKVPQGARLSAGGGAQSLFGQCPNVGGVNEMGLPLV